MSHTRSLVVCLCLAVVACKGADSGEAAKSDAKTAAAPAQPAEQAPPPASENDGANDGAKDAAGAQGSESETGDDEVPAGPLPESFDKVGVAECDDYVAAHVACIDKMPEAEREAARRSVFDNVESWKQTAAGGASAQKGLQTACRIALEQAKRATQELGCEW